MTPIQVRGLRAGAENEIGRSRRLKSLKNNDIELKYIRTTEQIADILTKGLGERQHTKLRTLLTGL